MKTALPLPSPKTSGYAGTRIRAKILFACFLFYTPILIPEKSQTHVTEPEDERLRRHPHTR